MSESKLNLQTLQTLSLQARDFSQMLDFSLNLYYQGKPDNEKARQIADVFRAGTQILQGLTSIAKQMQDVKDGDWDAVRSNFSEAVAGWNAAQPSEETKVEVAKLETAKKKSKA